MLGARPGYIDGVNEHCSADIRLPCARCGSLVLMATIAASVPLRCERCSAGRGVAYTVQRGGQRLVLDQSEIINRIRAREIEGTDFLAADDSWMPLAEHPLFRRHFFPGNTRPPPKPPPAPPVRPRAPVRKGFVTAGLLALAGLGVSTFQIQLTDAIRLLPAQLVATDAASPQSGPPASEVPAVLAPKPDGTVASLAERVGKVPEPRALLLAGAWSARFRGGGAGMAEAIRMAERAAVRMPDSETLAMLGMLYSEARVEPDLRVALIRRAQQQKPDHVSVVRAEVALAMAERRPDDAVAMVARCLVVDPNDTWCGVTSVDLNRDLSLTERMHAYDALGARSQPAVGMVLRKCAISAIAARAPDAARRVETALTSLPGDAELTGARAVLALRRGDLKLAVATALELGDKTPVRLRLDLAGHDIGAGEARSARAWLAPLAANEPEDPDERFWLHVHSAQADYLEAIGSAEAMKAAAGAADRVLASRPYDATAAQVRMLAALAAGDLQGARKAWGNADNHGLPGPDVAQLLLTAAELALVGQVAREAMPQLESAQRADPASPDVWLWTARIALEAQDSNMAIKAMRSAITHVDGSATQRHPLAYALPRPADAATVLSMLHRTLDTAVGQERGLAVSLAAVEWLRGNHKVALEHVARLVQDKTDPEAMVLASRIWLANERADLALPLAEAAAAARPKEGEYALLRARCLHALGRTTEALKALEYVRGGAGVGAGYHVLLGHIAGSDRATASQHGQDALAIDPYAQEAVGLLER
ncbi:MAG: hypothetical protein EXR69_09090 [Myxococcales bacterium]|nr:hypothetical protein [Myxococcales bacterium]